MKTIEDMRDLDELKAFVLLHSRAQQLDESGVRATLDAITGAGSSGPGSWVYAWTMAGDAMAQKENWLEAARLYNLARFPFVASEAQRRAHRACIDAFQRWLADSRLPVERWTLADGAFKAYVTGLDQNRPVLIVTGGIVSIKEQWGRFLQLADRLKRCVVVTEMPGVGENRLPYAMGSRSMFGAVLDALEGRADTRSCHLAAWSFSGHLGLAFAAEDRRVAGVTTVGAPIAEFFSDRRWFDQTPVVTRRTLAHVTGLSPDVLFEGMRDWALTPGRLARIRVPVFYQQSEFDEVIPQGEAAALARIAADLRVHRLPDVHGSPHHLDLTALWVAWSVLATHPGAGMRSRLVHLAWRLRSTMRPRKEYRNVAPHA